MARISIDQWKNRLEDVIEDMPSAYVTKKARLMNKLASLNGITSGRALSLKQYTLALAPFVLDVVSAFDKVAGIRMVLSKSDFGQGAPFTRLQSLKVSGDALDVAADMIAMRTFICKFPKSYLESYKVYGGALGIYWYSEPYEFIGRFANGCDALKEAYEGPEKFPYLPETINGADMADLVTKKRDGAMLYYALVELVRANYTYPVPAGQIGASTHPLEDLQLFAMNDGTKNSTVEFIYELAREPRAVEMAFSVLLSKSESEDWQAGRLSRKLFDDVVKRYAGTASKTSGEMIEWLRRNSPYQTGKQAVRAELAHRLAKWDYTSTREEHTRTQEPLFLTLDNALKFCMDRGMGVLGYGKTGERGWSKLVEFHLTRYATARAGKFDPIGYWGATCKPAWVEPPATAEYQWNPSNLDYGDTAYTLKLQTRDYAAPEILNPKRWIEVSSTGGAANVICVRGTGSPRSKQPGEE